MEYPTLDILQQNRAAIRIAITTLQGQYDDNKERYQALEKKQKLTTYVSC